MLGEVWKALLDYLKRTPYWPVLEPVSLVGFLYVGLCVVSYQYVQWRYQVTLDPPLFLQSYLLKQVSVVFVAVVLSFIALTAHRPAPAPDAVAVPRPARAWLGRAGLVLLIGAVALYLVQRWSPESRVSPIRVRFAAFDAFASPAEAPKGRAEAYQRLRAVAQYLLYEINHRQRAWQLEFDTTPFRTDLVAKADEDRCTGDDTPPLCIAEAFQRASRPAGEPHPPLVLIIAQPLGGGGTRAWFWLNRGPVSVITMNDWGGAERAGSIEFLAYALVVQSVMIHLQQYCGLAQPPTGAPPGIVVGNVFDLQPGFDAMQAAVLSGHFSAADEQRLLNCVGPDYLRTAVSLLSLAWLRSDPVRATLRKVYQQELAGG